MPAQKGGLDQLCNTQLVAGAHQVIVAIGTHGNPAGTGAPHPARATAPASPDAAGIGDPIRKALSGAGYASQDNFTTGRAAQPYAAITREARQTGRARDGKQPETMNDSRRQLAARLDPPEGKALYRRRSAMIEPVFAQPFNRLGRDLHYRDTKADLEPHPRAASHNFLKATRHKLRHTAKPAPAPAT